MIEKVQPSTWTTVNVCPATVAVPLRCGPLLAAALKLTVPLPLPAPLELSVSQGACGEMEVDQAQPAAVATAVPTPPPDAATDWEVGVMAKVQPDAWLTVKVWPATVSVPVRAGPVLAPTVKFTGPLPVPEPLLSVIHGSLLVTFHPQPEPAVTAVLPVPPAAPIDCDVGEIENAQPFTWFTVNV